MESRTATSREPVNPKPCRICQSLRLLLLLSLLLVLQIAYL